MIHNGIHSISLVLLISVTNITFAGQAVPPEDLPDKKTIFDDQLMHDVTHPKPSSLDSLPPPQLSDQMRDDAGMPQPVRPTPFRDWKKFGYGDSSTWYYFSSSIKPLRHVQTGKYLGKYVWAGYQREDGSYFMAQYQLFCSSGSVATNGAILGNKLGEESAGDSYPLGYPARPNTFDYVLSSVVCARKEGGP
jgi:hypothetical protein